MSLKLLLLALCALLVVSRSFPLHKRFMDENAVGVSELPNQWFTQKLDHFGDSTATFQQRYLVNNTVWNPSSGPIFVMLGGEGKMRADCASGHFVVNEYADIFDALIVCIEHRFYGETQPFTQYTTENLEYLTSQQGLADFAAVTKHVISQYGASKANKVISFGGSYSGALSAWFRQQYPDLVDMALASSAPILAQVNYPEYLQVVSKSFVTMGSSSCARTIQEGTNQIAAMRQSQLPKLENQFAACTSIEEEYDWETFVGAIADTLAGFVQYNNDNNGYFPFNVEALCQKFFPSSGGDSVDAIASFVRYWNNFGGSNCTEVSYADSIREMSNTDPNAPIAAGRAWYRQTCAEFGYYQVGSSAAIFSQDISLGMFLQMCEDLYGIKPLDVEQNIQDTNRFYGALKFTTPRVFFTNGEIDPWSALGMHTIDATPSNPIRVMKTTAHCADLYPSTASDPHELTLTRSYVVSNFTAWLSM